MADPAQELANLRRSVEFEIGVLRDFQAGKPGLLGKFAGEVADALQEALDGRGVHADLPDADV